MISWLFTGFQRVQAAFNSVAHRIFVSADTEGPSIVYGLTGR